MSQDQDLINFQATHTDHLGKPLTPDGVLGPRTLWARAIDALPHDRKAAVARAIGCLGVQEQPMGSNRGPDIDYWLKRCGIETPPPGVPAPKHAWCAAFASWVIGNLKRARVYDLVHNSGLKKIPIEEVQPADLGCILRPDGTGHVWTVIGKRRGWTTMNIEGNTSNAVRCTLRLTTPETIYLKTFPDVEPAGIIDTVPYASSSTT